jgi:threonine aldolase
MDGARFASALAFLDVAPAEISWKAGVDALSFGATKNGAMAAEAIIVFDSKLAETCAFRRMRAGHLLSKLRYISAQLEAYLTDDLWLRNARHANAMAQRLEAGLAGISSIQLRHPVEANEVFVELPEETIARLEASGAQFYRWDGNCVRLVASFSTTPQDVDAFIAAARP